MDLSVSKKGLMPNALWLSYKPRKIKVSMIENSQHKLNAELQQLENQLSELTPVALSEDFFMDLCVAVESVGDVYENDIETLEKQLGLTSAVALPDDMLLRMANAMDRWHQDLPVEEKVVSFGTEDRTDHTELQAEKVSHWAKWRNYSAAAAVALLGAVTALVAPNIGQVESSSPTFADVGVVPIDTIFSEVPRDAWLVPDSLSHSIVNTTENGVVMSEDNKPQRWIQIEYIDRARFIDDHGREIEVEYPGTDMMLVPIEVN